MVCSLFINEWTSYKPDDHGFEISFHRDFQVKHDSLSLDVGRIPVCQVYHSCKNGSQCGHDNFNALYSLVYMDYPSQSFESDSLDLINVLIQETLETRISEMKGKLDYSSTIENDRYKGILFRISSDSLNQICKGKFIVYNDRFIALQALTNLENRTNPDITTFLDSFKVIE